MLPFISKGIKHAWRVEARHNRLSLQKYSSCVCVTAHSSSVTAAKDRSVNGSLTFVLVRVEYPLTPVTLHALAATLCSLDHSSVRCHIERSVTAKPSSSHGPLQARAPRFTRLQAY